MVNLEHKLTIDDLIAEYMMYKVNNGYEPSFSGKEFMAFLSFFEKNIDIEIMPYDSNEIFERFFKRKNKQDWFILDLDSAKVMKNEHMHMEYDEDIDDYIISAAYKLSDYDKSVINTYFMDNGMSKYDDYKGTAYEIRNIIGEYLKNSEKRKIDSTIQVSEEETLTGKYLAAGIVKEIWNSYIDTLIESGKWPKQCRDINKYLLDNDLSTMIEVDSIKDKILDIYNILTKRLAIMYHNDKNLKITSYGTSYLANANYKLLIEGYEDIFNKTFYKGEKSLKIDTSIDLFEETHEVGQTYFYDDDVEHKTISTQIENDKVKKIIKSIEKKNQ